MCGLAGAILGKKRRRRDELRVISGIFTELLILNETRGTDAAGVAVIRKDGAHKLFKRPGPASAFVEEKLFHRVLDLDNKATVLLGHTRRKTRGTERNNRNNQPLRAGRSLTCHNGHVRNADVLARKLKLPRRAEVDSEVLCRIFDKAESVAETQRMLSLCRGRISAAYVRLDEPDRLCLLKGDMPLSAAWVRRLRVVLYASEDWMLDEALGGFDRVKLEIDPMTLSFLDAEDPLDFTQHDVTFKTPEAQRCRTTSFT